MPTKKSKSAKSKVNKSAFVRSMPNAKANDVVEAAKAKGIKLTAGLVYAVRSSGKGNGKSKPGPKKGRGRARAAGDDVMAFRRLVLSIGLPAAEKYLGDLKASVGL